MKRLMLDLSQMNTINGFFATIRLSTIAAQVRSLSGFMWLLAYLLVFSGALLAQENAQSTALALDEHEKAFIQAHPIIRVGIATNSPPFGFYKGADISGFSRDYAQLIGEKLGVEIEFVSDKNQTSLHQKLKQKHIDVLPDVLETTLTQSYALLSMAYLHDTELVVTRRGERHFDSYRQMASYTLVLATDQPHRQILQSTYPKINLMFKASPLDALQSLASGQADVLLISAMTYHYLTNLHFIHNLKTSPFIDAITTIKNGKHFATRDDWPVLNTLINRAMSNLDQRESNRLNKRWIANAPVVDAPVDGLNLRQAERDYLANKGPLNVCVYPHWMPFIGVDKNNKAQGLAIDVVKQLAQTIGATLNTVPFSSRQSLELAILNKRCDLVPVIQSTTFIRANLDFSYPVTQYPYVVVTREQQPFIHDIDDVKNKVLVALPGNIDSSFFRGVFAKHLIHAVETPMQGINQVLDGTAYGYIDVSPVIAHTLAQNGLFGVKINGRLQGDFQLSIASSNEEKILGAVLSKAVAQLPKTTLDEITHQWINVRFEHGEDYTLVWRVLISTALLIVGFLLWHKKLSSSHHHLAAAHEQLKKVQGQMVMQEKMASLGTLTAGVAHEINNPTNFVHVSAQNMKIDLEKFKHFLFLLAGQDADEAVKQRFQEHFDLLFEQINTIQNGSERIKTIVQELRAFTRLDSGAQKTVNLVESLRSTIHLVQSKYKEQVDFETHCHFEPLIDCQPSQLNQVFMNILVNACEAIKMRDESAKSVKGNITVTTIRADENLKITIADNGCGMDDVTKKRLFEPFYTTKGVGEGTGLGMSISFGIIKDHQGFINVTSELGKGSQFIILLPLKIA